MNPLKTLVGYANFNYLFDMKYNNYLKKFYMNNDYTYTLWYYSFLGGYNITIARYSNSDKYDYRMSDPGMGRDIFSCSENKQKIELFFEKAIRRC